MAEPTLINFQQSTWEDTVVNGTEATPAFSWQAGDYFVVIGATEDNSKTLSVPTATGLTFSQVTATNTGNNCKVYIWDATATGSGSGAISSSETSGNSVMCGIAAFQFRGSDGRGNAQLMASTTTMNATVSLTRGGVDSWVVGGMGDWNAVNDVTVTANPSTNGTVRVIKRDAGGAHATLYCASWAAQGSAGATSYGIGSYTATPKWIGAFLEVKGQASTGTTLTPGSGAITAVGTIPSMNFTINMPPES